MQALEMKMQMKTQNQLLNSCFSDCVQSFREESLTSGEKSCLQNCAGRALKTMELFGAAAQQAQGRGGMGQF